MENKPPDQPTKQQEVTIQLTEEQQRQIQRVTGKLVAELKVEMAEDRVNPVLGGGDYFYGARY